MYIYIFFSQRWIALKKMLFYGASVSFKYILLGLNQYFDAGNDGNDAVV